MKNSLKIALVALPLTLFIGCSKKNDVYIGDVKTTKPTISIKEFDESIIQSANKAERYWKEYVSLLEQRQELTDSRLKNHIPVGMGNIVDLDYQGYLGNFLQLIADKSGYIVEFQNFSPMDTPVMSVKKYRTTIYDILKSVMGMYDYDVKILESEKRMIISLKV